eukprot:219159-Rhodomonas_salina.1
MGPSGQETPYLNPAAYCARTHRASSNVRPSDLCLTRALESRQAGKGEPVAVFGDCDFVVTWETALACP